MVIMVVWAIAMVKVVSSNCNGSSGGDDGGNHGDDDDNHGDDYG